MATHPAIENARRQLEVVRSATGTPVTFRGDTYLVRVATVSGAQAGQTGVPREGLRQFIANTVPTAFKFNASDFQPATDEPLPETGEFVVHTGFAYEITAVSADIESEEAFSIRCQALKAVYPTLSRPVVGRLTSTMGSLTLSSSGTVV